MRTRHIRGPRPRDEGGHVVGQCDAELGVLKVGGFGGDDI